MQVNGIGRANGHSIRNSNAEAVCGVKHEHTVILAVILSTFFVGFGGGVVFPILPNLGAVLGISPFLVGLILSANRFVRTVANTPAGALVDRIGTRTPFVAGLFIEAVATLGYIVAMLSTLPEAWFLLARIIWGIGSALVFATAYTIAADVSTGKSRGTNMGVVRGGMTLGFPAGLVLGGVVSELFSIPTAFALAAAFDFGAGGLAYATIPETHVSESKTAELHLRTCKSDMNAIVYKVYRCIDFAPRIRV